MCRPSLLHTVITLLPNTSHFKSCHHSQSLHLDKNLCYPSSNHFLEMLHHRLNLWWVCWEILAQSEFWRRGGGGRWWSNLNMLFLLDPKFSPQDPKFSSWVSKFSTPASQPNLQPHPHPAETAPVTLPIHLITCNLFKEPITKQTTIVLSHVKYQIKSIGWKQETSSEERDIAHFLVTSGFDWLKC